VDLHRPDPPAQTPLSPLTGARASARGDLARRFAGAREASVLLVLVLFLAWIFFFSSARSTFFSPFNMQNLLRNIALLATFAIGETIVIITAGIDLSLGSLIAFSGMILAFSVNALAPRMPGAAVGLAILIALAVSLVIGAVHAGLIHYLRLPPFVVTLASLTILRSQAMLLNKELPISIADFPFLGNLANGRLFPHSAVPIPIPVLVVAFIAIVTHILLSRMRIGRYVYSLGNNEQATRLSGVNVARVQLFAYGVSALLGGVAGILYAGYGGQGDPLSGSGYELNAVAAAVIGGANLMGGQGSVAGTLLGATLLQVIITFINIKVTNPSLWEGTVYGGVLLLAVMVTAIQQRRKSM